MKTKMITQICACAMAVGLILAAIGFFSGADLSVTFGADGAQMTKAVPHTIKKDSLSAFQAIDLQLWQSNVEIIPSDRYGVEINYYGDEDDFNCDVSNDTLSITEHGRQDFGFHMDFGFIQNKTTNTVKVYLPKETALQKLTVKDDLGNLKASDLKSQSTQLNLSFGKLELSDSDLGDASITLQNGSCKVNNLKMSACKVKNDFGSTTMEDITVSGTNKTTIESGNGKVSVNKFTGESLEVNDHFGSVSLTGVNLAALKSVLGNGTIQIENSTIKSSKIENSFGNVEATGLTSDGADVKCKNGKISLSGTIRGITTVHSDFGEAGVNTTLAKNQCAYNVSTSFGDAKVDGTSYKSSVVQTGDSSNVLTISSQNGSAILNFTN